MALAGSDACVRERVIVALDVPDARTRRSLCATGHVGHEPTATRRSLGQRDPRSGTGSDSRHAEGQSGTLRAGSMTRGSTTRPAGRFVA